MSIFEGAGVAIVTPFTADGRVNYEKFEELIEFQIKEGTDAIITVGTTGEASTLSHAEHIDCIKFTCDVVKGRVPVIAGTGSNCTDTAIYLSQAAEECGVDGVLLVTPYYNKATQKGLIGHYSEIAQNIKVPAVLYNVPSRTGTNITPATAATLFKTVPNIVGIKEASGNFTAIAEIANMTDGKMDIYSGNDDQVVPILALGGKGVISVWSNIAPKTVHDMCAAFFNGDLETARKIQIQNIDLINALFCEVNPIPVKEALNMMGFEVGGYRKPLCEMEPAHKEVLRAELVKAGLLK